MLTPEETSSVRSHAYDIKFKADQITDQTLESTRSMVRMLEESRDVGTLTIVELDEQGEQLERINNHLDQMKDDMKEAERNLTALEKCCGLCVCPCNRTRPFKVDSNYEKIWNSNNKNKDRVINSQPIKGKDNRNNVDPNSGFIARITNDAREDEMDENMHQVSNLIGNLKNMAIDMEAELDSQNERIHEITTKAECNVSRIDVAIKRADAIS